MSRKITKVVEIKYYKTALVEVDETGRPVNGNHTFVPAHPETDFMKKNKISIIIMSLILSMWFGLRLPVYRISDYLAEKYGLMINRKDIYRYIDIVSAMLMPVFQRMQYESISKALLIGLDETFWKVRQKFGFGIGKQDEPPPEVLEELDDIDKADFKTKKSTRTFIFAIVTEYGCMYYHSVTRAPDFIKKILIENGINPEAFVACDGYYKKSFFTVVNENGELTDDCIEFICEYGLCWIHVKRMRNGNRMYMTAKCLWIRYLHAFMQIIRFHISCLIILNLMLLHSEKKKLNRCLMICLTPQDLYTKM